MKTKRLKLSTILVICLTFAISACGPGSFMSGSNSPSLIGGDGSIVSQSSAAQNKALQVLANNCNMCHFSNSGPLNVFGLTDVSHLIASGLVIPGNPNSSPLLQSIEANRMPTSGPLSAADKQLIRDWIQGGAVAGSAPVVVEPLPALGPNYNSLSKNIFIPKCAGCHSDTKMTAGYAFDNYTNVKKSVRVGNYLGSMLYTIVQSGEMPPTPNPMLSSAEQQAIADWITAGALNN